jgi:hypothetical protein
MQYNIFKRRRKKKKRDYDVDSEDRDYDKDKRKRDYDGDSEDRDYDRKSDYGNRYDRKRYVCSDVNSFTDMKGKTRDCDWVEDEDKCRDFSYECPVTCDAC